MNAAPDTMRPVAVFDFDRTLIDTDVAYHFLDAGIKRSKVRRIAFGMLMPLLLPLLLMRRCRVAAMSVIMWLATFPLHGKSAQDVFTRFSPGIGRPPANARFYTDGLTALAAHRRMGHRLVVISGSPQELVAHLVQTALGNHIDVIGSRVEPFLGGLVYRRYCMRSGKIARARERGMPVENWGYGYSDSANDIPLLARCRHRFLVNPTPRTLRRVKAALGGDVTILNWTATDNGITCNSHNRKA
ncbi:MAG TPA: haloacid dehalogenase-like hydrolase [Desulfosarcina sp.]|nr:haloacid dehalogenase-like hydrolase [Desulfosarcina sp.]